MSGHEIAFMILALLGLFAAARVVTTDNVVHAALYLVVTLAVVGGVYMVLGAEFVAWVQILIYVGAVVVLLLFSLMLTKAPIGAGRLDNQQRGLAALVGLAVFAGLGALIVDGFKGKIEVTATTSAEIGSSIFRSWVLPFEIVSVLLLAALVGAVVIARKDDEE
jgi:NADH-quinone oxidoreductase subunit J